MGENRGSFGHLDREEMNYVVKEDQSWMRSTRSGDNVVNAAQEGSYDVNHDTNPEVEYPAYSSEHQGVGKEFANIVEGGHRRVCSAADARNVFLFENGIATSESSERDMYAKEEGEPVTQTKDIGRQCEHLQLPLSGEHSDPAHGDSHETVDLISKLDREIVLPIARRSHSMDSVSSWLRDASIGESLHGLENNRQQAHGHYDTTEDSQSMMSRVPSSNQHVSDAHDYEENELAIPNQPQSLSPGSIYRGPGDQRPLSNKAFDFVRKGAVGFATVSQKAAVEIAKVSRTTSKQVRNKSIEFKNLAAPVLAPIFQVVIEEGRDQGTGAPERELDRVYSDQREGPNSAELERMATPYVQPIGNARGGAPVSQRQMQQQQQQQPVHMMRPTMQGGRRLVVSPVDSGSTGPTPSAHYADVLPTVVSASHGPGVATMCRPRPSAHPPPAVVPPPRAHDYGQYPAGPNLHI